MAGKIRSAPVGEGMNRAPGNERGMKRIPGSGGGLGQEPQPEKIRGNFSAINQQFMEDPMGGGEAPEVRLYAPDYNMGEVQDGGSF